MNTDKKFVDCIVNFMYCASNIIENTAFKLSYHGTFNPCIGCSAKTQKECDNNKSCITIDSILEKYKTLEEK